MIPIETLADEIAAVREAAFAAENREIIDGFHTAYPGALRAALARLEAMRWRPIAEATEIAKQNDGWIPASLFAIKRDWGWEQWIGQCDAADIWLGRSDDGSCFETEPPTHWQPLPSPPELQE